MTDTRSEATEFVVTCIESNGDATASRDEYDVDAIVSEMHDQFGGWDFEFSGAPDEDQYNWFWSIIERHAL